MEAEPRDQVPGAVFDATRSLFRLRTGGSARRVAECLVRELGGQLVPAGTGGPDVIQVDVSFGDGEPLLPAAAPGSAARALLERHLATFLLDARLVLQLSGQNERLAESASTDLLTGLPNRRMLERALGRLSADDTVIMLDLDHFKQVNDTFGHAAGDAVLRVFGRVLGGTVRGRDVVGRFGGEEFLVVLPSVEGADAFLSRLRAEWLAKRPFPVTFSAGIAASAGDPDETVSLADQALYQAKKAGRDQWIWALARRPAGYLPPTDYLPAYLRDAVLGHREAAVRLTLDLLDRRVSRERIVVDLLAAAQREVGHRWYCNELTPADEHLASGVTAAALDMLMGETSPPSDGGLTVVTCAEGDFHALAAQMFGELLREHGLGVMVLGASMPADVVAEYLVRSGADSLAVSCSVPIFLPGALRLIDAAHRQGIPVIAGGQAFGTGPRRAERLGADGWALTAADAAAILLAWKSEPPSVSRDPMLVDPVALCLSAQADALGDAAFDGLTVRLPRLADYDERQIARTREDLVFIVRFLAATLLAADHAIFADFLDWLENLLVQRGVPPQALIAGLEALRPVIEAVDTGAALLLDLGRQGLLDGLR
ncbi:MAG TPA: diguanylate cyclase [Streptosporangiaceae bacterium]|nr:diguanylate cyclase [Streptosporangiaceae bacterium]